MHARPLVPDFIVVDPKQAPVWEIAGQGFIGSSRNHCCSISETHAILHPDSISHSTLSIRFPRVTRIRDDKDFSTHTDVPQLQALAKASAEGVVL